MRVLMISGDKNLRVPGTAAQGRFMLQARQVEELSLFVWPQESFFKPFFVSGKYDVVTAQDPFWRGLLGLVLARRTGAKLNLQVHADLSGQSLVKHVLARILLKHADSVRVVSQKIKEQILHMGVQAPIQVLPVFVDVKKFASVVHKPHEGKNILWVGRFETEKNPMLAIDVLRQVRAGGVDAELVMLGSGSQEAALRAATKGLPVEFPGWRDPAAYLEVTDIFLNTSPFESFGASIVEALAAGVPAISFDVGVAKEAGARIAASSKEMAAEAISILSSGAHGELALQLLDETRWAEEWKKGL